MSGDDFSLRGFLPRGHPSSYVQVAHPPVERRIPLDLAENSYDPRDAEAVARVKVWARRVRLTKSGWLQSVMIGFDGLGVILRVYYAVPDRETGEPVEVGFRYSRTFQVLRDDEACNWWLRECLVDAAIHEVSEGIYVDGERVFDPHR